jgi:ATP-dependent Clp protease ATP-binding subunit ClpA
MDIHPNYQAIIDHAIATAKEIGHNMVGTDHVLWGIMHVDHGLFMSLVSMGLSRDDVLRMTMQSQETVDDARPSVEDISEDVRAAMRKALQLAESLRNPPDASHLLYGLSSRRDNNVGAILRTCTRFDVNVLRALAIHRAVGVSLRVARRNAELDTHAEIVLAIATAMAEESGSKVTPHLLQQALDTFVNQDGLFAPA